MKKQCRLHTVALAPVDDRYAPYGGVVPAGDLVETVSIDGTTYAVMRADNFGSGWRCIAVRKTAVPRATGSLNVASFMISLRSAGLARGNEFLSPIDFGN